MKAFSTHKNFYENLATRGDVGDLLKDVEKLVREIAKAVKLNEIETRSIQRVAPANSVTAHTRQELGSPLSLMPGCWG